jgi:hypothetical protein
MLGPVATFGAASLVGPTGSVLAIEADVDLCGLLQRSAALDNDRDGPVTVLPVACGDQLGVVEFAISSHGTTTNALAGFGRLGGVARNRQVIMVTLDWLATCPSAVVAQDW